MKICLPVDQLNGLESEIAPNFRAAPSLLVIDSVSRECLGINASSGACKATPTQIDAIICAGGIGRGMFNGLRGHGIRVFNTAATTVAEALAEFTGDHLEEVHEVACCGGGHHDHAQAHQHAHGEGESCGCGCDGKDHGHGENGCGCGGHH